MRWLITWATAEPIEVTLVGLSWILAVLTGLFGVGCYRAARDEMREQDESDAHWPQEGNVRR